MTLEEQIAQAVTAAVDQRLGPVLASLEEKVDRIAGAIPPQMLTVKQAADILGVHPHTIRKMAAAGELAAKRVGPRGGSLRIDASSLHGAGGRRRAVGGRR